MKTVKNIFGEGILYEAEDLKGKIYTRCCACISIYSDFESWANKYKDRFVNTPSEADTIIVLGCQVTDLAVLADIRNIESLVKRYPGKEYFIGGCLAKRFDIELPVKRLDIIKSDYTTIKEKKTQWGVPFWVKNFNENDEEYNDGHLFRNMYPLRIGVGCKNKCAYCTIRITRGICYELNPQINEFLENDNILLNADSPSAELLKEWIKIAIQYNKPISIRNVEPQIAIEIENELIDLSDMGLLNVFHMPVQSTDVNVLKDMNRNPELTLKAIEMVKKLDAFLATNIIVDYKDFPNPDMDLKTWDNSKKIKGLEMFDYISWNPYWDGIWDRENAEQRFEKYIGGCNE